MTEWHWRAESGLFTRAGSHPRHWLPAGALVTLSNVIELKNKTTRSLTRCASPSQREFAWAQTAHDKHKEYFSPSPPCTKLHLGLSQMWGYPGWWIMSVFPSPAFSISLVTHSSRHQPYRWQPTCCLAFRRGWSSISTPPWLLVPHHPTPACFQVTPLHDVHTGSVFVLLRVSWLLEGNKRRLARDASRHLVCADWWAGERGARAGSGQEASRPQRWAEDWAGGSAALQPPPVPRAFLSDVLEASPCHKLTFLSGIQMSAPPLGLSALDCLFRSLTWNAKSNVNTHTRPCSYSNKIISLKKSNS